MNKKMLLAPVVLILSGCPTGDRFNIGQWKPLYIDKKMICFTVDKNDTLSHYYLGVNRSGDNEIILSSHSDGEKLTYPQSCMSIALKPGNEYFAVYELNKIKYRYEFIIDNTWKVIGLE